MASATRLFNSKKRSSYFVHKNHRVSKKLFFRSEGLNSGHLGSSLMAGRLSNETWENTACCETMAMRHSVFVVCASSRPMPVSSALFASCRKHKRRFYSRFSWPLVPEGGDVNADGTRKWPTAGVGGDLDRNLVTGRNYFICSLRSCS